MSAVKAAEQMAKVRGRRLIMVPALLCIGLIVFLGVLEILSPAPRAALRRDFTECVGWIEAFREEQSRLPSTEEFRRFAFRRQLKVKVVYEIDNSGVHYRLRGWDGQHRWQYDSRRDAVMLVE